MLSWLIRSRRAQSPSLHTYNQTWTFSLPLSSSEHTVFMLQEVGICHNKEKYFMVLVDLHIKINQKIQDLVYKLSEHQLLYLCVRLFLKSWLDRTTLCSAMQSLLHTLN